jgi:4'-phosphopantetheinyl transferase
MHLSLAAEEVAIWRLPSDHPAPLETVLARYTGVDLGPLDLELTPQGKPRLPGSRLRFNLAHSGEVALVAVTRDHDVGVDVERVRPDADRWALVDHALTARERRQLQRIAPTARAHAFLSMWARKEALLKAAGVGLGIEPALIELDGDSLVAVPQALGTADDWTVMTVPLPGYVAAVAVRGDSSSLTLRSLEAVVEPSASRRRDTDRNRFGHQSTLPGRALLEHRQEIPHDFGRTLARLHARCCSVRRHQGRLHMSHEAACED